MRLTERLLKMPYHLALLAFVFFFATFANAEPKTAAGFTLKDTTGKVHSLSDYKGKIVVIEFFNPECPFIKRAHQNPATQATIKMAQSKGVIWLAVNSNQPGKQGATLESNAASIKSLHLTFPILMNPSGSVGRAYNATRTPEVVIIGKQGEIVYQGAVDSSGGSRHTTGTVERWLDDALTAYLAGKPIIRPQTKPWGCSIKY